MSKREENYKMIQKHLETLAQKFVCLACKKKIQKPVLTKCGHHFCHVCITKIIKESTNPTCPCCDDSITEQSLISNTCTNKLFNQFEALLKACKEELKIIVKTPSVAKVASSKQNQKKNTEDTAKNKNQPIEPKSRGRKTTLSKSPAKNVEFQYKSPPTLIIRSSVRRKSAIEAANRIPTVLQTEESSPDTPQQPIPELLKRNSTQTKVSTWLKEAETDVIPTQDPPVVSTTPVTQSTLIAVSQSKLLKETPTISQIPEEYKITERIIKDPYEFIPSQPDSIKKGPRRGLKSSSKPSKPVIQKKHQSIPKKKNEDVDETSFHETGPMLLFQSQSEQYIAAQEEKRLQELEKPIYLTTEAAITKQRSLKSKALPLKQYQAKKKQHLTEDSSDEYTSPFIEQPRKKARGSRGQPIPQSQDKHEKMQKKLEDAEKHCLIIEKSKIKSNKNLKNKFSTHNGPTRSNRRSLSIAIESPPVSVAPDKIAKNFTSKESEHLTNMNVTKKAAPSPGFSRIKKMKSDFKSPVRNTIVPLDVSTSSLKDTSANLTHHFDSSVLDKEIRNISSPSPSGKRNNETLQASFNSSLGAPDLEKNILLHKAVEQMEFELQNNIITDSDLDSTCDTQHSTTLIENSVPPETNASILNHMSDTRIVKSTQIYEEKSAVIKELSNYNTQDTQQSTTLIENSVPRETNASILKHMSGTRIVKSTQIDEEESSVVKELSNNDTQDTQHSTTLIENSVPLDLNAATFKCIPNAKIIQSTQESPLKEIQLTQTKSACTPLQEFSNKVDVISQRNTQMSQTTVNLLEKIHDLPKRKTFSLEADTGDIMIDIPTRESTQQQLLSLNSTSQNKSQNIETADDKSAKAVADDEPQSLRFRFVKQGKLYATGFQKHYQVPFYKLGYLSPKLQNKGLKYQSLQRCSCGGMRTTVKDTISASTNTSQPVKTSQYSAEAQTTPSLVPLETREVQTSVIISQDSSLQENSIKASQNSLEVQTTPSLVPVETKGVQTSLRSTQDSATLNKKVSQSLFDDTSIDNNLSNNLNIARFIPSHQELMTNDVSPFIKIPSVLKTSTQKFLATQDPLFSDSMPSSISQNDSPKFLTKKIEESTHEVVAETPFFDVEEPMEVEDDEEVTVIEKTQEENETPFTSGEGNLNKLKSQEDNSVKKLLDGSNQVFTINSDDILQATLSQPLKSTVFHKEEDEDIFESPTKMSKTSTPMSKNESDYVDEDVILMKSQLRSKRRRALRISSDSESENEIIVQSKRPSRLSMKKLNAKNENDSIKKLPVNKSAVSSATYSSDAPIRAIVQADLVYARAVAAEPSSGEESVVTITLESTPVIEVASPATPCITKMVPNTEIKKTPTIIQTTPESIKKVVAKSANNVLETLHDDTEDNHADTEVNNPFMDYNASLFDMNTSMINQNDAELHRDSPKGEKSRSNVAEPFMKMPVAGVKNMEKKQLEESDSDSDVILENTPKRIAAIKESPSVSPSVVPRKQISIVYSGLDADSVKMVDRFLKTFKNVKHSEAFMQNTTHVVVPYENSRCTNSTLKFLLAVACGRWVVSINWIKDCLAANKIIPEETYEMADSNSQEGPKLSRISTERLFKDFEIHCGNGTYRHVTKKHLEDIVTCAGGQLIDFQTLKMPCIRKYRLVITPSEEVNQDLQDCKYPMVLLDWVVESVEQFRLASVSSHLARTIDDQLITEMNLPKEMLEAPEEDSTSYTSTNFTNTTITQP